MKTLPTRQEILEQEIATNEWKNFYGDIVDFIKRTIDGNPITSLQIVNGVINPTQSIIKLDTENQESSDELVNIGVEDSNESQWLLLYSENINRKITIKNSTSETLGGIFTIDGNDIELSTKYPIILTKRENSWQQLDICGYSRATDEELEQGLSDYKVPTVAQIKPFLNSITATQIGVIFWASIKPAGTVIASNAQTYDGNMFPDIWRMLNDGTLPSVTFAQYNSAVSSTGFCDDYALDVTNNQWKTPHLTSIKFGETDYLPYIGTYSSAGTKSIIELQSVLDLAIETYNSILEAKTDFQQISLDNITLLENTKTQSLADIDSKTSESILSINSTKSSVVSAVETAGDNKISIMDVKAQEFSDEVQEQKDAVVIIGTTQSNNLQAQGVLIIDEANESIAESKKWATGDITENPDGSSKYWYEQTVSLSTSVVDDVNSAGENQILRISNLGDAEISDLTILGNTQTLRVQTEGNEWLTAIEDEGDTQLLRLQSIGNEAETWATGNITERPEGSSKYWHDQTVSISAGQILNINEAGESQLTSISNTSTLAKNEINLLADNQIIRIEAYGNVAEDWAIGDIVTIPQGSAKYWAEKAKENSGGSGTNDHELLINRSSLDQHPISSITNLQSELDSKALATSLIAKADKSYVDTNLNLKQNVLTAGDNVTIANDVISVQIEQGTLDHSQLINRNLDNQHSISSIGGLQDALDTKASSSDVSSKAEKTYVDTELAKKSNITYVDEQLLLKANTSDLSNYATNTALNSGLNSKQDILTAGDNITIENNVISASGGGGESHVWVVNEGSIDENGIANFLYSEDNYIKFRGNIKYTNSFGSILEYSNIEPIYSDYLYPILSGNESNEFLKIPESQNTNINKIDNYKMFDGNDNTFMELDQEESSWTNINCVFKNDIKLSYLDIEVMEDGLIYNKLIGAKLLIDNNIVDEVLYGDDWEQPILSSNGEWGVDDFAVRASSNYDANYQSWKAVNGTNLSNTDCWISQNGQTSATYDIFTKEPIIINNISITNRNHTTANSIKDYEIQTSIDGSEWNTIYSGTNTDKTQNSTWIIDIPSTKSHIFRINILNGNDSGFVAIGEIKINAKISNQDVNKIIFSNFEAFVSKNISIQMLGNNIDGYPPAKIKKVTFKGEGIGDRNFYISINSGVGETVPIISINAYAPDLFIYKDWEQPILSSNGEWGVDDFAVRASSNYDNTNYLTWKAVNGTNLSNTDCWISQNGQTSATYDLFVKNGIIASGFQITNRTSGQQSIKEYEIQKSVDGEIWETFYSGINSDNGANSTWTINIPPTKSNYFRINMLSSYGSNYLAIGEINLVAKTYEEITPIWFNQFTNQCKKYNGTSWQDYTGVPLGRIINGNVETFTYKSWLGNNPNNYIFNDNKYEPIVFTSSGYWECTETGTYCVVIGSGGGGGCANASSGTNGTSGGVSSFNGESYGAGAGGAGRYGHNGTGYGIGGSAGAGGAAGMIGNGYIKIGGNGAWAGDFFGLKTGEDGKETGDLGVSGIGGTAGGGGSSGSSSTSLGSGGGGGYSRVFLNLEPGFYKIVVGAGGIGGKYDEIVAGNGGRGSVVIVRVK